MIKMKKRRFVLLVIGIVLATLLVAAAGFNFFANSKNMIVMKKTDYDTMKEIGSRYAKLYSMQNEINEKFLWETNEDEQMESIYRGLLNSLNDKYSKYMNQKELKEWNDYMNGTFTGVGVSFVEDKKENFVINGISSGSPAEAAGLKEDDIILEIDGKRYQSAQDLIEAFKGEEGTKLTVKFERSGKVKKATLTRAIVAESTAYSAMLKGKIGYIKIKAFDTGTADQFKTELANVENKGAKSLIIDLRGNGGGFTKEGISIADMLLPECTITYTENKAGKKKYYNSDEKCTDLKYAVLINGGTASTSEIVAAAIKDNQGGKLIGTSTYGKGIIQSTLQFKDDTAIKLTVMQYFSPKGKAIQGIGIKPDFVVKLQAGSNQDAQLRKAMALLS